MEIKKSESVTCGILEMKNGDIFEIASCENCLSCVVLSKKERDSVDLGDFDKAFKCCSRPNYYWAKVHTTMPPHSEQDNATADIARKLRRLADEIEEDSDC